MTVETQENKVKYIGDGAAVVFPVPFPVAEPEHLRLYLLEGELETEITGGYEVIGAGTRDISVVMDQAPANGVRLTMLRRVPYTQPMDLENGGSFNAETLEGSADNQVLQIQQLAEESERTIKWPVSSNPPYPDAQDYLNGIQAFVDAAKSYAEWAASLVDPVSIEAGFNIRRPWVAMAAVASGGILTLPGYYYPGGRMLVLWYNGAVCSPRDYLVEASGHYQYEETGGDLENPSNQVKVYFDVAAGDVLDMLVLASVKGDKGDQGEAATVRVGTVTIGADENSASVSNSGSPTEAVFDFTIPRGPAGAAATISVGTVTVGEPGSPAKVGNSGNGSAAIFDFTIPQGQPGQPGQAATIAVGTVSTGAAGSSAKVTNAGTGSAAIFDFSIPRGEPGPPGEAGTGVDILGELSDESELPASGEQGDAYLIDGNLYVWSATTSRWQDVGPIRGPVGEPGASPSIQIGTVITGAPGSPASVTNSGTETEPIFDFVIPKGEPGADAAVPPASPTVAGKVKLATVGDTAATPDSVAEQITAVKHTVASSTLSAGLSALADFTVPSYVVGAGKLMVFMDGAYCRAGSNDSFQYKEVGPAGAVSVTIQFYEILPAGTEITAVSKV